MKKFNFFVILFSLILVSCENQDWEYQDFDYTSTYFPYQTPARVLILGDYDQGYNENDNNHRFQIGAVLAGVYSNSEERSVYFEVDETLLDNVSNVVALPQNYYSIETTSPVIIEIGSTKAVIDVQLTDDFFNDSLSIVTDKDSVNYVIPLRIMNVTGIDSVLSGLSADGVVDPIRTNLSDWEILPKDYTLFGIKFINEYHGNYLRRGIDYMVNDVNEESQTVYHADFVEQDELVRLASSDRNSVLLINRVRRDTLDSPGELFLNLEFDETGNCIVSSTEGSLFDVMGTGSFKKETEMWGGKTRNAIYLEYTYLDNINSETHHVFDTLVVRDRDVVFEAFTIFP